MTTDWAETIPLVVSDIKNYMYCRRTVYFAHFLPGQRPTTYKMQEGKLSHQEVVEREERRSLRAYKLEHGEREFSVMLQSDRLGLSGLLDMVIVRQSEAIPVEFKNSTGRLGMNHRYQLVGYALLVEERYGKPVRRGFVYFIPLKRAQEVIITPNMRRYVTRLLREMREMLRGEVLPPATGQQGRCVDCEYRRYC